MGGEPTNWCSPAVDSDYSQSPRADQKNHFVFITDYFSCIKSGAPLETGFWMLLTLKEHTFVFERRSSYLLCEPNMFSFCTKNLSFIYLCR